MTTKLKFKKLNDLRTANNMKPLKAWKESVAKLDAAIAKLEGDTPANLDALTVLTMTDDAVKKEFKKIIKQAKKKPATKAKPKAKPATDTFTVAELARELGMNPKIARAKMRRHKNAADAFEAIDGKWVFPNKRKADVSAFLLETRTKNKK